MLPQAESDKQRYIEEIRQIREEEAKKLEELIKREEE